MAIYLYNILQLKCKKRNLTKVKRELRKILNEKKCPPTFCTNSYILLLVGLISWVFMAYQPLFNAKSNFYVNNQFYFKQFSLA